MIFIFLPVFKCGWFISNINAFSFCSMNCMLYVAPTTSCPKKNQVIELYVLLSLFICKTNRRMCIWCWCWWWCFYCLNNWTTCLIVFFTYYSIIFSNNLWFAFCFLPFRSVFLCLILFSFSFCTFIGQKNVCLSVISSLFTFHLQFLSRFIEVVNNFLQFAN